MRRSGLPGEWSRSACDTACRADHIYCPLFSGRIAEQTNDQLFMVDKGGDAQGEG